MNRTDRFNRLLEESVGKAVEWGVRRGASRSTADVVLRIEGGETVEIGTVQHGSVPPYYIIGDPTGEPYATPSAAGRALATKVAAETGLRLDGQFYPPAVPTVEKQARRASWR